jgi:hypothetical protein
MSYDRRKQYFENLKILVKSEYEEVFRILKRNKVEYTENSNGIFFDVSLLTSETFKQLEEYMEFCLQNRRADENRSKELASLSEETTKFLLEGYSST